MSDTHCVKCGEQFYPHTFFINGNPMDTGYGTINGERVCYGCCALIDLDTLKKEGKIDYLYLVKKEGQYYVCNWPGTLKIGPVEVSFGRHNIAGKRVDCWVYLDGAIYHGVQLGRWSDIVRIKRTKQTTTRQSTIILSK